MFYNHFIYNIVSLNNLIYFYNHHNNHYLNKYDLDYDGIHYDGIHYDNHYLNKYDLDYDGIHYDNWFDYHSIYRFYYHVDMF